MPTKEGIFSAWKKIIACKTAVSLQQLAGAKTQYESSAKSVPSSLQHLVFPQNSLPKHWHYPDFPDWQNRDITSVSDLVLSADYELEYFPN